MAIWDNLEPQCACGEAIRASTLRSFDGRSRPDLRQQVLNGTLHRARCPACGVMVTIERSFIYLEGEDLMILVRPRDQRPFWTEDSAIAVTLTRRAPSQSKQCRVVYGMSELREKLVIRDLELRDEAVELMKLAIHYASRDIACVPGLRLILDGAEDNMARFIVASDTRDYRKTVRVELAPLRKLGENWEELACRPDCLVGSGLRMFAQEKWINMWRWSPHPWALAELRRRMLAKDGVLDFELCSQLPRTPLQQATWRLPLMALADRAGPAAPVSAAARELNLPDQEEQLEKRFNLTIDDNFAVRSPEVIAWFAATLDRVPEIQLQAADLQLDKIILDEKQGDIAWYDPSDNDIVLGRGVMTDSEDFEHYLLHEIGHVIHARFQEEVDTWLSSLGWKRYPVAELAQIEEWLREMGAWDSVPPNQRQGLQFGIQQAFQRGNKLEGPNNPIPPAGWGDPNAGPYQAYLASLGSWWKRHSEWFPPNGKRKFYFNFQYFELVSVPQEIIDYAVSLQRISALLSEREFFAEIYSAVLASKASKGIRNQDRDFVKGIGLAPP